MSQVGRIVTDNWDAWNWDLEVKTVIDDKVQVFINGVDGCDEIEEQVVGEEEVRYLRGQVLVLHWSAVRIVNLHRM